VNPDDEEYLNRLPPPQPSALQAIGLCSRTYTPSHPDNLNLRSFELRSTVYDRNSSDHHSTTFSIRCYLPSGGRFNSTPLPERNAVVSVCGEIVGIQEESGIIAILLHDLTFLSARSQKRGTLNEASSSGETSSPKGTPGRKRAWDAWGQRSSGKRRVLDTSSPPASGSSQETVGVEYVPRDGEF
jgi:hypothetical protein